MPTWWPPATRRTHRGSGRCPTGTAPWSSPDTSAGSAPKGSTPPPGGLPGATLCGQALDGGNPDLPEREEETFTWFEEDRPAYAACYRCQRVRGDLDEEHYAAHLDPLLTKRGRRYYEQVRARRAQRW